MADEPIEEQELDIDPEPEELDEPVDGSGDDPPEPQKIYRGKFKTADDLDKGYGELEKKSGHDLARLQKLTEQLQQWGCSIDPETVEIRLPDSVIQQQQAQQQQQQASPNADDNQALVDRLFENPDSVILERASSVVAAARQMQKQADANTRSAISKYRTDPLFSKLHDEFETELMRVDDRFMADKQQSEMVAENIYYKLAGKFAIDQAKNAKDSTDPASRTLILESFGLSQSEPTSESGRYVISAEDRRRFEAMGLSDKDMEAAAKSVRKQMKGERNA